MLAFLFNLGFPELVLTAAVAVMIFGRRLPDVAGKAYAHFHRARQGLERLRRESGIETEMRSIQRNVREAADQATLADSSVSQTVFSPTEFKRPRRRVGVSDAPPAVEDANPTPSPDSAPGSNPDSQPGTVSKDDTALPPESDEAAVEKGDENSSKGSALS